MAMKKCNYIVDFAIKKKDFMEISIFLNYKTHNNKKHRNFNILVKEFMLWGVELFKLSHFNFQKSFANELQ